MGDDDLRQVAQELKQVAKLERKSAEMLPPGKWRDAKIAAADRHEKAAKVLRERAESLF